MKKHSFPIILALAVAMFGCGESSTTSDSSTAVADSASTTAAAEAPVNDGPASDPALADLLGYYVGSFEAVKYHKGKNPSYNNRINLSIDQMNDGKVKGHSVVAGNMRPFEGTYLFEEGQYAFEVKEPGDDKYDGAFSFALDPTKGAVVGTWTANDPKIAVYERKYELEKKEFKYDPELQLPEDVQYQYLYSSVDEFEDEMGGERLSQDVLKFNPSTDKLKAADIENMYKGDLEIMRNSIYARHGYSFKTRKMRYVFDNHVDWYIPVSTDVSKELTALENENIALIKRYEQHADSYYDSFGR